MLFGHIERGCAVDFVLESLLRELIGLIEAFEVMEDAGAASALWNSRINPLLSRIAVLSGLGKKVAQEYAYRYLGFEITAMATEAELATLSGMIARKERNSIIKRAMARAVSAEAVPAAGQIVTGLCLCALAYDLFKLGKISGQLRQYQNYMGRYTDYMIRNAAVHDGKIRLTRPALPLEYAKRDPGGAWWQC